MVATGHAELDQPGWLRISMNPATGNGGTCYGDSGGPNFLGHTDIVAATTITGDAICRVDQRRLPARHAVGAGVPVVVRRPALTVAAADSGRGRIRPG